MRSSVRFVALIALLAAGPALASRLLYLARDELICASQRVACIDGSLTYDVNNRLLDLHGRVHSAPGPGTFTIRLKGSNRLGHVRYAPMEVALRGNTTEIVDFRMIPDYPDVYNWEIDGIDFIPARED